MLLRIYNLLQLATSAEWLAMISLSPALVISLPPFAITLNLAKNHACHCVPARTWNVFHDETSGWWQIPSDVCGGVGTGGRAQIPGGALLSLEHSSFNKLNLDYSARLVARSFQTFPALIGSWLYSGCVCMCVCNVLRRAETFHAPRCFPPLNDSFWLLLFSEQRFSPVFIHFKPSTGPKAARAGYRCMCVPEL